MRFEEQAKKIIEIFNKHQQKTFGRVIPTFKDEEQELTEKIADMIEEITDNQCLECEYYQDTLRDNIPEPDYSKEEMD